MITLVFTKTVRKRHPFLMIWSLSRRHRFLEKIAPTCITTVHRSTAILGECNHGAWYSCGYKSKYFGIRFHLHTPRVIRIHRFEFLWMEVRIISIVDSIWKKVELWEPHAKKEKRGSSGRGVHTLCLTSPVSESSWPQASMTWSARKLFSLLPELDLDCDLDSGSLQGRNRKSER